MDDPQFRRAPLRKAGTGIDGLDAIMEGGLPAGRPTLLCGAAGCGKTLFGVTFLAEGSLRFGEPGVLLSFEERPQDISENVASLGYDLPRLIAKKKLFIDQVQIERSENEESGSFDLEGLFVRLGYAIDAVGAKRVVLDTIENLFAGLSDAVDCAQRASPPVHMAQGKRRHRHHHRRTWRRSADAPRAGGVCVGLRYSS